MRTCLSPFARVVDRAVREAMPGVRLSAEIVRKITIHMRTAMIAYLQHNSEMTIQGFGTFKRELRKSERMNRPAIEPHIIFYPWKSLKKEGPTNAMD